jgi:DNA-binding NarL/FixJ family response regulator
VATLQATLTTYYRLAENPVVQANPEWLARLMNTIAEAEERLICLVEAQAAGRPSSPPDEQRDDLSLAAPLALAPPPPLPPAETGLTARHREVVSLLARGYSNAQIARELVIEPGTAANHVAAILTRLGLRSRTEIAVWALRHGLSGHATPVDA